ncbi:thioredoxin [Roseospira marina]|uniref:Thioredoxin n=2 Tax=Roseospira marina TaxID=140057 RepID=A0A5M6ICI4_9PROT|nr:thioredoxin [Roseospira marina]KAA5605832.1 thioredoxin [Roseospira marina]MBB4313651.1 thioredoxin 1 [Roseospira marina]MBB5086813.1 thioredoxin 1 [Roseospira marina]
MASVALTKENIEDVIRSDNMVIVDFWADWCEPCKTFGPTFEKISDAHPDVTFAKVDVEAEAELAQSFGVRSIPTVAVLRDRVVLFNQAGALPESDLESVVSQGKAVDMAEVHQEIERQQQAEAAGGNGAA